MRKIMIKVAYDGTRFCGWQRQTNGDTIQNTLENALAEIQQKPVTIYAAGRTDSGVHATGQVAHFSCHCYGLPPERYREACNRLLPGDIRVLLSRQVSDRFHARYDALSRSYLYRIRVGRFIPPMWRSHCSLIQRRPDLAMLNRIASTLVGEWDFAPFAHAVAPGSNTIRSVYRAAFYPKGEFILFTITANGFLWRMVRSLVGTILELERAGNGVEKMKAILDNGTLCYVGPTMASSGLALVNVRYGRLDIDGAAG